jgi:hypothetical protein
MDLSDFVLCKGAWTMARKRKKEKRKAAVNEHQVLLRDLKMTFIWLALTVVIVGSLGVIRYTLF